MLKCMYCGTVYDKHKSKCDQCGSIEFRPYSYYKEEDVPEMTNEEEEELDAYLNSLPEVTGEMSEGSKLAMTLILLALIIALIFNITGLVRQTTVTATNIIEKALEVEDDQ